MSMDILQEKIRQKKNPTVAGLDPRLDYIPAPDAAGGRGGLPAVLPGPD